MVLESLYELVAELNRRIQTHQDMLQANEAMTRYVLIDPLLRALGWETENPAQVHPEYRPGSGSADYALMVEDKPAIMVEAKKLGTPLRDGVLQGINYCLQQGTPYFAVTDGRNWEVYDIYKRAPMSESIVVEFDIGDSRPSNAVMKMLSMWRPHLESGSIDSVAPVRLSLSDPEPQPNVEPPVSSHVPSDTRASDGWQRLPAVQPKPHDPAPRFLKFPDGTQVSIDKWVNLPLETVKWLSGKGVLTPKECPIQRAARYIVSMNPSHPDGSQFRNHKRIGQFYVEANYSGRDQFRNTMVVLRHVAQDAGQYSVLF